MKKITSIVLSICLILSAVTFGVVFSSADSGNPEQYKGQGKTLTELSEKWSAVTALKCDDTFTSNPNYTTAPYSAGELSTASQNYATAYLNFARYLADVPTINLNAEGAKLAQAAAVVNRVNNALSHTPSKPAGMGQALYDDGFEGAGITNIGWGYSSIYDAIGRGWLNDTDSSNIAKLGHRTNFLSPALPYTGFGKADKYYAGMALCLDNPTDRNKFFNDLNNFRGTIMYPAPGYFPIQALPNGSSGGAAWSIQFDRTYDLNNSNIVVKVNNRTTGEVTTLTESDQNVNGKYLSKPLVNQYSSSLGMISFRVSTAALKDGDEYTITVSGIKDCANIEYDVCIVDMNNLPIKGDVDADGKITATDALLALQIVTGKASASEKQLWAARVEADDAAAPTSTDALIILKKALGLIDNFFE